MPNDRTHIARFIGSGELGKTGIQIAANLQHLSGKPWAATAQVKVPQGDQRILLESRGSRRLSSQTLFDVRLSKTFSFGSSRRVELLIDALNLLNETAEEGLASDNLFGLTFGQPSVFVNPRRVMIGIRTEFAR
jgi:hypothetical protein